MMRVRVDLERSRRDYAMSEPERLGPGIGGSPIPGAPGKDLVNLARDPEALTDRRSIVDSTRSRLIAKQFSTSP